MRLGLAGCALALCALPASGEEFALPQGVLNALTPVDSVPSKSALNDAFETQDEALTKLRGIALDSAIDLGVGIRAIRALPAYCPSTPPCGPGTPVHDTLIALITSQELVPHTPQDLLRLRAAIESLGAIRSGLASDVDVLMPLLGSPSRDVRTTVVRAMLHICTKEASEALKVHYKNERVQHVKKQMDEAIVSIETKQCPR